MNRAGGSWRWTALACLALAGACDGGGSGPDAEAPFVVDVTGTCPSGTVLIPGGEFTMGRNDTTGAGADGSWAPAHRVRVRSFCLDATPVTAAAYAACVEAGRCPEPTLSAMPGCAFQGGGGVASGQELSPMNCVAWTEADSYCRAWSNGGGGALPTEAQWEFAATNGGTTRFPWGDDATGAQLCWNGDPSAIHGSVCPVAAHPANARGLRDMVGNVWVWTQDWFAHYPTTGAAVVDPAGPATGRQRTFRGASFGADTVELLSPAVRGWNAPSYRVPQLGFRCARAPSPSRD
jgi:formylglycine-generating enzyme required for sulfatase activity